MADFEAFPKIPRLNSTDWILTEKLDGTNGQVFIREIWRESAVEPGETAVDVDDSTIYGVRAGSRNRWITVDDDNYGFARWVTDNAKTLVGLGPGRHFGEWYGKGIQRGYGLTEKRFALFNVGRWNDPETRPGCCEVVSLLDVVDGRDLNARVKGYLAALRSLGSYHVQGFDRPEGLVVYHRASGQLFKALCENDDVPKSVAKADLTLAG